MLALVAVCALARGAVADEAANDVADPDTEAVHRHFEAGVAFYDAGRYGDAEREFMAAARIKQSPALEYNIARCEDRLERWAAAADGYERYLAAVPNAPEAANLRERIPLLRGRVAQASPAPPASPTTPAIASATPTAPEAMSPATPSPPASAAPAATPSPTVPPRPAEPVLSPTAPANDAQAAAPERTAAPASAPSPPSRRWLLWTAVGAAVVVGAAIAIGVAASNGSQVPVPSSTDGNFSVRFP